MKKVILIVFVFIFQLLSVFALSLNFEENIYYFEVVDIGIKDTSSIDLNVTAIQISIYSLQESYFNQEYTREEIFEIPIILDKQISSDSNIRYDFLDSNGTIRDSQEYELNISSLDTIPEFYFCNSSNCTRNDIFDNYNFMFNDNLFLVSENYFNNLAPDYNYNIIIQSNSSPGSDVIIFSEENINFPYEINKNIIAGYKDYKIIISISDNETSKQFKKEILFSLDSLTDEENRKIINDALNSEVNYNLPSDEIKTVSQNIGSKENIDKNNLVIKKVENKNNYNWIFLALGLIIVIIIFLILGKDTTNRRITRRK